MVFYLVVRETARCRLAARRDAIVVLQLRLRLGDELLPAGRRAA